MRHRLFACGFIVLCPFLAPPSIAADFCAHDEFELQAALTASQANGEDDTILILAGDYPLSAGLLFSSTEAHSLDLFGSIDDCAVPHPDLGGAGTVLDGQHQQRPLGIANQNGTVRITGLRFASGFADGSGAGLFASGKDVIVSANWFYGNRGTGEKMDSGGAALVAATEFLRFDDNLVFGNHAINVGGVTLFLAASGTAQALANTIIANLSDAIEAPGGLLVQGSGTFAIANNIIWNNAAAGGSDFGAIAANDRYHNDIGIVTAGGVSPGVVSGELSVDPAFEPCGGTICFDFELARSSPLVDAGYDAYEPLLVDLSGKPRVIGPHVDIGAFENDRIFHDGFDD
jgi:hypothetical protein